MSKYCTYQKRINGIEYFAIIKEELTPICLCQNKELALRISDLLENDEIRIEVNEKFTRNFGRSPHNIDPWL